MATDSSRLRPRWGFRVVLRDDVRIVLADEAARPHSEYLQIVKRLWPLARRYWFDAVILAVLGIGVTGAVLGRDHINGPEGPLWFDELAMLAIVLPLLGRRRFPFGAPAAVGIAAALISFVDKTVVPFDGVTFLAGCVALFLVASLRDRFQAIAGFAIAEGVLAVVVHNDPRSGVGNFVVASIIFAVVWAVAFGVGRKSVEADEAKERAARAEREREERARAAVAEERARIARELHDVVGHSVSVMTVQASGVRRLLRPSLDHLSRLVDQAREAGLPVELRIEGEAIQLPAGVDLTAYRLVQEGLTNVVKHAEATRAEVLVNYSDSYLEVTVRDDGKGVGNGDGGGHGLVGMRERVSVYGGELDAGPQTGGGYRLCAKLPLTL